MQHFEMRIFLAMVHITGFGKKYIFIFMFDWAKHLLPTYIQLGGHI